MIFLSFKTYKKATGENAISLCSLIKNISKSTDVPIIPAVQVVDISEIKKQTNIEVWSQHVDAIDPGRHFGWISPYSVKQAGATGVVINHLEHELSFEKIKATVQTCQKHELKTLVIVNTFDLAKKVIELNPNYLAYENANLIGGNISMVDYDEQGIKQVAKIANMPLLIGAGIKNGQHVKKALNLGAQGVILASAVIQAENQEKALKDLISGFH